MQARRAEFPMLRLDITEEMGKERRLKGDYGFKYAEYFWVSGGV